MTTAGATYCYRHPDRSTRIRCQRCERQVCLECQTPGAVGVICPECFAAERADIPGPRLPGRSAGRPTGWALRFARRGAASPTATYTLIALCVAVYLAQQLPGLGVTDAFVYAGVYSVPEAAEPWRLVTNVFAHSPNQVLHILLNMYTLWVFGPLLEALLGRARFVALYLIAGIAGSIGVLWLASPLVPVLGASGAIFGLFGALLVIQRSIGNDVRQLAVLVGINLIIGFLPGTQVAWQAHVGGLLGGAAVGAVYSATRRPGQQAWQRLGLVGIVAGLAVLSLRYVWFPII